ncbi:MAG: L-histidine N(alpha)-methyltransferase, partial [Alphaproteobacteria bacterium]
MNYETSKAGALEDRRPDFDEMLSEVREGLLATPKTLPCKYFYDEKGSDLFRQICDLPEYYLTRTETSLLTSVAGEIAELVGPGCQMIEYGSGSSDNMWIVLSALNEPESFTAINISKEHLLTATKALLCAFAHLKVHAVTADFAKPFTVPAMTGSGLRVGFFPGSTIGNFTHEEVIEFLKGTRKVVGPMGVMLIGVDLKKDVRILRAAYNDSQGVTAAFNMNLLARLNRDLGTTFNLT